MNEKTIQMPTHPEQLLFLVMVPCHECRGMGCYSCNHKGTQALALSLVQVAPLVRETLAFLDKLGADLAESPPGPGPELVKG